MENSPVASGCAACCSMINRLNVMGNLDIRLCPSRKNIHSLHRESEEMAHSRQSWRDYSGFRPSEQTTAERLLMRGRTVSLCQLSHDRPYQDFGLHSDGHSVVIGRKPDANIAFVQEDALKRHDDHHTGRLSSSPTHPPLFQGLRPARPSCSSSCRDAPSSSGMPPARTARLCAHSRGRTWHLAHPQESDSSSVFPSFTAVTRPSSCRKV